MPSGRTHDAITILLTAPAFAASYAVSKDVTTAAVVTACFVFGGLMFGPDLDTVSRQYSRWWIFKSLWFPYRTIFKHRSRWSHGLIFGTFFRVVYFFGVLTLGAFLASLAVEAVFGVKATNIAEFLEAWHRSGTFFRVLFGQEFAVVIFAGLWLGAASHTVTDMAGSFIKTGRIMEFL